jgi:PASTA domain
LTACLSRPARPPTGCRRRVMQRMTFDQRASDSHSAPIRHRTSCIPIARRELISPGAAQQGGQAPHRRRRSVSQPGRAAAAGRLGPRRSPRRMASRRQTLPLRNHTGDAPHTQRPNPAQGRSGRTHGIKTTQLGHYLRQGILTAMSATDAWEQGNQAWRRLATRPAGPDGGDDALAALSDIGAVRRLLDQAELAAVRSARRHGKSWAEIATHLGVARQSAWERWRDLDDSPAGDKPEGDAISNVTARAAADLTEMRAREQRRSSTVTVPHVVGLEWINARDRLNEKGLVAINAEPDAPLPTPTQAGWIVTDQSPESGAWVMPGSAVRLWLDRNGGAGVREPRRPRPTPRPVREMRSEPSDEAVG